MNVEFITSESGDWIIIKLNGAVFYSGHDLSEAVAANLLRAVGAVVTNTEITDEEMEDQS